jgi:lipopolysaccharide/colanic/teichoic acid biosynthesis glycosyltransferase
VVVPPAGSAAGRWGPVATRAEDLVLGTILLVLTLPLMGVIALAIRLDTAGPALFRQTRRGLDNRRTREERQSANPMVRMSRPSASRPYRA